MLTFHPTPAERDGAPPTDAVWIDLLNGSEAEIQLIEDHTGLRLPTLDDLAEIEQSSRQSFADGVLRLAAPIVAQADTDHPKLSYVGVILTGRVLITVRFDQLKMFDLTVAKACEPGAGTTSAQVFATLMEAFVDRQADLLEIARARLDQVSHMVFRPSATSLRRVSRSNLVMRKKLQTIGGVGERISIIRESLLAVDRMIPFALEATKDWFDPALAHRLSAVRQDIESLNLFEEHLSNKVQFLLDAVLGFIGIEQNDIFKVLTIASVVGIFPTLVAGWYGMNFRNMPEYGWTFGYQYGIAAIVASTILPLLWFKWRGWM
ncbi:MAG: magnesium transporter CorA family protein [Caulobacteraceae bacterium]|nr:magnesium transporter CorA family protein [Caulobacteraceae bacterium]